MLGMSIQEALQILKDKVKNPKVDEHHQMDILDFLHMSLKTKKVQNMELWFKELKELVEYEE